MGGSMTKVLPGLYVGALENTKNEEELMANGISHIIFVQNEKYEFEKSSDRHYLQVVINENDSRTLTRCVVETNDFIHAARVQSDNVLVCSDSGMSASVAVVAAYLMSVYELDSRSAIGVVQSTRHAANPVASLQDELERFEGGGDSVTGCTTQVNNGFDRTNTSQAVSETAQTPTPSESNQNITAKTEHARLLEKFGAWPRLNEDEQAIFTALESHKILCDSGFYLYDPDNAQLPINEPVHDRGDLYMKGIQFKISSEPQTTAAGAMTGELLSMTKTAIDSESLAMRPPTNNQGDESLFDADSLFDEPADNIIKETGLDSAGSMKMNNGNPITRLVTIPTDDVTAISTPGVIDEGLEADEVGFEPDESNSGGDDDGDDDVPGAIPMPASNRFLHGVATSYHQTGSLSRHLERLHVGHSLSSNAQYHTNVGSVVRNVYQPSPAAPSAYNARADDMRLSTTAPFRRTFW